MDFTTEKYNELLIALNHHRNYRIRHDVDLRPEFALRIAGIEQVAGVESTYYFRAMHFESHAELITKIHAMGHSIGYHYENLSTTHGDMEAAYNDFSTNLKRLREIAPVSTACAHGSPRSPWNNQSMWKPAGERDIHTLGIDYEPMIDTDFSKTLYLTDTGRRWDGFRVSVRDKVPEQQERWEKEGLIFHSTDDIIHALNDIQHPIHKHSLLINTHPQRWMPFGARWMAEAGLQWGKNIAKRIIVATR